MLSVYAHESTVEPAHQSNVYWLDLKAAREVRVSYNRNRFEYGNQEAITLFMTRAAMLDLYCELGDLLAQTEPTENDLVEAASALNGGER
ncbi:MAG: hypothetical protein ABEL51_05045 [Salinibacter sp.]